VATTLPNVPAAAVTPIAAQMPELAYGRGLKPAAPDPNVALVQQRLGVTPADGRFGNGTRDAVIAFQVKTGLAPNLPIADLRKRGFGAVKRATWEKLLEARA